MCREFTKEDACGRWGETWEKLGELSDGDVDLASDEGGGGCLETSWFSMKFKGKLSNIPGKIRTRYQSQKTHVF